MTTSCCCGAGLLFIENSYEFPKVSRSVLKLDKGYSAIRGGFQSLLRAMSVSSSLTCYNEKR